MAGQFVVTRGGRETFYTVEELQRLAAGGLLHPSDMVLHPRLGRWLPASEVPELERELAAAAELGRPPRPPARPPRRARSGSLLGAVLVAGALGLFGAAMIKERRPARGPTPLADGPAPPRPTTGMVVVTSNGTMLRVYRDEPGAPSSLPIVTGSRELQVELPANVDVWLRVEADGRPRARLHLRLQPGETRHIPIGLARFSN
jgi:hypothetical protein